MKVGDLIRPVIEEEMNEYEELIPYLMQVTEIVKTGFNVILLSGPHFGCEIFFPKGDNRRWEIISE